MMQTLNSRRLPDVTSPTRQSRQVETFGRSKNHISPNNLDMMLSKIKFTSQNKKQRKYELGSGKNASKLLLSQMNKRTADQIAEKIYNQTYSIVHTEESHDELARKTSHQVSSNQVSKKTTINGMVVLDPIQALKLKKLRKWSPEQPEGSPSASNERIVFQPFNTKSKMQTSITSTHFNNSKDVKLSPNATILSNSLNVKKYKIRNDGSDLEQLLKHQMKEANSTRFQTTNFKNFGDNGSNQRLQNLSVEQNDARHVRRQLEITNKNSLRMGSEVTNTLTMPKAVINRLKTYVELKGNEPDVLQTRQSLENLIQKETERNDLHEWTPCRWSDIGWKYQKKGTFNQFLNSTFKINAVGGRGPTQTEDQLRNSYFPPAQRSQQEDPKIASQNERLNMLKTKIDSFNGVNFSQPSSKRREQIQSKNNNNFAKQQQKEHFFNKYNEMDFCDKSEVNHLYNNRLVPHWKFKKFSPIFNH